MLSKHLDIRFKTRIPSSNPLLVVCGSGLCFSSGSPLSSGTGLGSLSSAAKRGPGSKGVLYPKFRENCEIYGTMSTIRGVGLRNGTLERILGKEVPKTTCGVKAAGGF